MTQRIVRAYLRRNDYAAFHKLSSTTGDLPATYELWHEQMDKEEASLAARGCAVERIFIEPAEFSDWSRRTGFSPNRVGREAFAIEKAAGRAA